MVLSFFVVLDVVHPDCTQPVPRVSEAAAFPPGFPQRLEASLTLVHGISERQAAMNLWWDGTGLSPEP